MTTSLTLVGSAANTARTPASSTGLHAATRALPPRRPPHRSQRAHGNGTVSYTHLTLPTICSV
eukprot:2884940-Prorocentrum_lima.AAC.1